MVEAAVDLRMIALPLRHLRHLRHLRARTQVTAIQNIKPSAWGNRIITIQRGI